MTYDEKLWITPDHDCKECPHGNYVGTPITQYRRGLKDVSHHCRLTRDSLAFIADTGYFVGGDLDSWEPLTDGRIAPYSGVCRKDQLDITNAQ